VSRIAHAHRGSSGGAHGGQQAPRTQIVQSSNIELAAVRRFAAALGYNVAISLTPAAAGRRPLHSELDALQP
jgi:hypothetical protein